MSVNTVSLQTARELKENGFRQDTHFYWHETGRLDNQHVLNDQKSINSKYCFSAPTTDELLEELPYQIENKEEYFHYKLHISKYDNFFTVRYELPGACIRLIKEKELPEALAQMWLYLKKEGLLCP